MSRSERLSLAGLGTAGSSISNLVIFDIVVVYMKKENKYQDNYNVYYAIDLISVQLAALMPPSAQLSKLIL